MPAECRIAILRHACPDLPELVPGMLLQCPRPFLSGTYRQREALCCLPKDASRRWIVPRAALLPYHLFLKTQPVECFWAAVSLESLKSGRPLEYLSNVRSERLGPCPFHFESLGELLRYFQTRGLLTGLFRWLEVKPFTPPARFLQREIIPESEAYLTHENSS